jgi:hypothetical protein
MTTMMTLRTLAIASALVTALGWAEAQAEVIKPHGYLTPIKTAAGEITMVHTIIPMNNAHDVEILGFVKRSENGSATQIPFELDEYEPFLNIRTGADCKISAARIVRDSGRLRIIYAQRKGEWLDKKPVTLQLFELAVNNQEAPGTPPMYFMLKKQIDTMKPYCDVNDALDKEGALYMSKEKQ